MSATGQNILPQDILNSLVAHAALLDASGRIETVNRAWIRFAVQNGVTDPDGEFLGEDYLATLRMAKEGGVENAAAMLDGIQRVLDGSLAEFQSDYPCKTLTADLWFRLQALPLARPEGGAIILHEDITVHRAANSMLLESAERFHILFNHHEAVMMLVEPVSGAIIDANLSAERFYGYPAGQLKRMSIQQINLLPPAEIAAQRIRASRQDLNSFIFPHLLANGEVRTVEVHSSPICVGGQDLLFSIVHDITARHKAEQALADSEEKFSRAFFVSPDALLLIRLADDRILEVNDSWERITGYSRTASVGRSTLELGLYLHPETSQRLTADAPIQEQEVEIRSGADEIIWTSLSAHQIQVSQQACLLVIIRDIRQRKQAEARAVNLNRLYRTISQINHVIVRVRERKALLKEICRITTQTGGFRMAWIGFADPETGDLRPCAFNGEEQGYLSIPRISLREAPFNGEPNSTALREGRCAICQDIAAEPAFAPWRQAAIERGYRAIAAVPIMQSGCTVGALAVYSHEPYTFDDNNETLLAEIGEDISYALAQIDLQEAHQAAEMALQRSESLLNEAQQIGKIGYIEWTKDANIVKCSAEVYRMFGIPVADTAIIRAHIQTMMYPEDRQRIARLDHEAFAAHLQFSDYEYRIALADGQACYIHQHSQNFYNPTGQLVRVLGVLQDVTELRRAEEARVESEQLYRASFEQTGVVKLLIDPETGCIVNANPAAADFFGCTLEMLITMTMDRICAGGVEECHNILELAQRFNHQAVASRHRTAGGEIRDVEIYFSPARSNQKTLMHAIILDVTSRLRNQRVIQAILHLREVASENSFDELVRISLDLAEHLAESQISFFHTLAPDQCSVLVHGWSTRTRQEFCQLTDIHRHLDLSQAGVWMDCIRDRKPIIHVNYNTLPNRRGLPPGHGFLMRELVVPVFRDQQIVAVLGVGNKDSLYNQQDSDTMEQFASLLWDILQVKLKEQAVQQSEAQLRSVLQATPEIVCSVNRAGRIEFINRAVVGIDIQSVLGCQVTSFLSSSYLNQGEEALQKLFETGQFNRIEVTAAGDYGQMRWFECNLSPIFEAGQVKSMIVSAMDITDRKEMEKQLRLSSDELLKAYDLTLEGWSSALELRERETAGHSLRVVRLTMRLAETMGMPAEQRPHLQRGALLHDLGKLGIPDHILLKPGPLSDDEWVIMRQHPQFAYDLLCNIPYLQPAIEIPYCHHEKWDGSGYPRGLKGENIPLSARIFSIVDVWDALANDRPYRPAWPQAKIIELLLRDRGKHFDPRVVDAFMQVLSKEANL